MDTKDDMKNGGSREYIHERVVLRKKSKRFIVILSATVGLALIFGCVAAVMFSLGRSLLEPTVSDAANPIVIARDDTPETSEPATEMSASESPEDSEAASSGEAAEQQAPVLPDLSESESEPENADTVPETDGLTSVLKTVYGETKDAFLTIIASIETDSDWFDTQVVNRIELFGVMAVDSEDSIFILTDAGAIPEGAALSAEICGQMLPLEIQEIDLISNLCILRADRSQIDREPVVLKLGNSFDVEVTDEVYMFGAPFGVPGAVDRGIITRSEDAEPVADGYVQLLYTDMQRAYGGSAVLLNADGEIIGWMSDYSAGRGSSAVVCGISPLKYIIEDLCSGTSTAYFGVDCLTVSEADAIDFDVPAGLYVEKVLESSPAYLAGIQPGDILVSINGKSLPDNHVLQLRLDDLQASDEVTVTIRRKSAEDFEELDVPVKLGGR